MSEERVYRNYANPKECLICHQIKPANEFYKAGGVTKSYCKDCMKKKYKEKSEHTRTLEQENKRLNNIIDELEKWLVESIEKHTEDYLDWKYDRNVYLAGSEKLQNVFNKLQELKGIDKE